MANYLIIGGTSGIGLALTKQLLSLNHQVFMTGRDAIKTNKIASDLNIPHAILEAGHFDEMDQVFDVAQKTLGVIDGVVNCAGSLLLKSAHMTRQEEYEKTIASNLTTAFAVVRSAGKYMIAKGGSVVLVSSAAALTGVANHEAIAAAKAGIIGLIYSAAATYASHQLRFNGVAPGLIETPLTASVTANASARSASLHLHALGRLGKPSDVASAIVFFLLPENNWVTGQILAVDGGLSRVHPKMKI